MARDVCRNISVKGERVTLTNTAGKQVTLLCRDAASAEYVAAIFQVEAGEPIPNPSMRKRMLAKLTAERDQLLAELGMPAHGTARTVSTQAAPVMPRLSAEESERMDRAMGLSEFAFGESTPSPFKQTFGLVKK